MPTADEFFSPWESAKGVVSSWATALEQVNSVIEFAGPDRKLAWRGLADSSYALHSSLYRALLARTGHVSEADLVAFEQRLLNVSRTTWRFDNLGALELFAQLQHFGAPTRMLDVTFNPLVALWFAVEESFSPDGKSKPDKDGRLVAFDVTDSQVDLDETWGGRALPWEREPSGWRSELPRVWRPPSYNERIPAQDSAFLLGGVPAAVQRWYRKAPGDSTKNELWPIESVREITSVPIRIYSLDRERPYRKSKPTVTVRIPSAAKPAIRAMLERSFGLTAATIYPDLYGLARHGASRA